MNFLHRQDLQGLIITSNSDELAVMSRQFLVQRAFPSSGICFTAPWSFVSFLFHCFLSHQQLKTHSYPLDTIFFFWPLRALTPFFPLTASFYTVPFFLHPRLNPKCAFFYPFSAKHQAPKKRLTFQYFIIEKKLHLTLIPRFSTEKQSSWKLCYCENSTNFRHITTTHTNA